MGRRILLPLLFFGSLPAAAAFSTSTHQQQQTSAVLSRPFLFSRRTSAVSLPTITAATTTSSSTTLEVVEQANNNNNNDKEDIFKLDYYDPNEIHPKTKTLTASLGFFAELCIKMVNDHRKRKRLLQIRKKVFQSSNSSLASRRKTTPAWLVTAKKLNEQRRNLVKLADYTASIVAPSFVCLIFGALMMSVIPHYYSQCIQVVATLDTSSSRAWRALLGLSVSSALGALFTGLRGSFFWIAGSRGNYNIRVKLHRNLLLQEAAFFDSTETGYLLSRLNNDVNKIGMVISFHVNIVCRQLAQFLFGSVVLIRLSGKLALVTFAGIAIVAWLSAVYGTFNRELAERVQDTFAEATAVAETSLSMSETIRAFNGVEVNSAKYETAQSHALELEETQAWGYGAHKFVSDTVHVALQVMLLFACWRMGLAGGLPAGKLTAFLFYSNFVLESSNEVGDQWAKIQAAIGASTSVFGLIRRIPKVRDPPRQQRALAAQNEDTVPQVLLNGIQQPPNFIRSAPIIEMSNMTIKYGAMDIPAVNGVDLKIYEGDRVAIVGRSGSGKSSMLRSILRFYDPTSGVIKLSGQSLKEMTRKELAAKVSVVEQEPSLFPMSLLENVLYGIDKDSVDSKTGEACYSESIRQKAADSLREAGIPVLPGNDLNLELDTRVGEGGRSLSGGQRQRVAIARALIRNPVILLLDEPTAALDSQSEKNVVRALRNAMEHSKSMVMVTHRLGVIRSLGVNRVVVMDKGKIVETGHPERLLEDNESMYASLAREQGITFAHISPSLINKFL